MRRGRAWAPDPENTDDCIPRGRFRRLFVRKCGWRHRPARHNQQLSRVPHEERGQMSLICRDMPSVGFSFFFCLMLAVILFFCLWRKHICFRFANGVLCKVCYRVWFFCAVIGADNAPKTDVLPEMHTWLYIVFLRARIVFHRDVNV